MEDDRDREAILKRRNRFIALALTGLTSAVTGCDRAGPGPQVCLQPVVREQDPPPGPCLEAPMEVESGDPRPCLSPPAQPGPCLEFAEPRDPADEPREEDDATERPPRPPPAVCLSILAPDESADDPG